MNRISVGIIDFGSQYTHLIARRIRELGVYSVILSTNIEASDLVKLNIKALILSGGPNSVLEVNHPRISEKLFKAIIDLRIPLLGICYGHQLIAKIFGGRIKRGTAGEYGISKLKVNLKNEIFSGLPIEFNVWMSHKDVVISLPSEFRILAGTEYSKIASFSHSKLPIYGVQFHPEVRHTEHGLEILSNFLFKVSNLKKNWNIKSYVKDKVEEIRKEVKDGNIIAAVSGGIDSLTSVLIVKRAIGSKSLHLVLVNSGLLRSGDIAWAKRIFKELGFTNLHVVNAEKVFLSRLRGIKNPELKRKIISKTFIEIFEREAKRLEKLYGKIRYLVQGTIYPDRVESGRTGRLTARIKSHHNVVLPAKMKLKVVEPLAELYKDEVRRVARELGVPEDVIKRHPFPGPGLAIRIVGEVTKNKIRILRKIDKIVTEEAIKSNLYESLWQIFPVLLPLKTVGVMGDSRTYKYAVAIRAVISEDAMTAEFAKLPWKFLENLSTRIIDEVKKVNRVLYDITNKPPATIEYE